MSEVFAEQENDLNTDPSAHRKARCSDVHGNLSADEWADRCILGTLVSQSRSNGKPEA